VLISGARLALAWPQVGSEWDIVVLGEQLWVYRDEDDLEILDLLWNDGTLGGRYPSLR
jgi:hypothetical protein